MTNLIERFVDFATGEVTADVNATNATLNNLDITNEALMYAEKTSDQSYATANGWVTITWDNVVTDVTGDFDLANDHFTVPETGYYFVNVQAIHFDFSDQDSGGLRLVNKTDSNTILTNQDSTSGSGIWVKFLTKAIKLDSAKNYEITFANFDGDDTIQGNPERTNISIVRCEEA